MSKNTAERANLKDENNYVYQRCFKAYLEAKSIVKGNVLEIGTGEGYGVKEIAPLVDKLTTIDQFESDVDLSKFDNVEFGAKLTYITLLTLIHHIVLFSLEDSDNLIFSKLFVGLG